MVMKHIRDRICFIIGENAHHALSRIMFNWSSGLRLAVQNVNLSKEIRALQGGERLKHTAIYARKVWPITVETRGAVR